jgi:hypothetical protein
MLRPQFTVTRSSSKLKEFWCHWISLPRRWKRSITPFGWRNNFELPFMLCHVYPPDEASSVPGAGHFLLQSAAGIERLNEELTGIHRKHAPTFRPESCHVRGGRPY